MSDESPKTLRSEVRRYRGPSAVWILPILAALIAGWLAYKTYSERGPQIQIVFNSAEGLEAGKTRVVYRGITAGTVSKLTLSPDQEHVVAQVEMTPEMESLLNEDTRFWLVTPQISLSGVKGLETLVSGYYIGMEPGSSKNRSEQFTALTDPPPMNHNQDGLYITLFSESAASYHRGSPIFFNDVEVGQVVDYQLSNSGNQVKVNAFIQPQYAHLVHKQSRFWNTPALAVKGRLPDVDIKLGNIATLIAGGISFYTPAAKGTPEAENGDQFQLYEDFEAAENGIPVILDFDSAVQLHKGMDVKMHGLVIGRIRNVSMSSDLGTARAELLIDPRARRMLREGTRFWLETPSLNLEKLDVTTLIRGSHIEMEPGTGEERFSFTAIDEPPPRLPVHSGREVVLHTQQLGSLSRGAPVLFKQLPIGSVTGYELDKDGHSIRVYLAIKERYANLIQHNSRFWNSSGISIRAGLGGVELKTGTVKSLITGGVSVINPPGKDHAAAAKDQTFTLFDSYESATDHGHLLDNSNDLLLKLHANALGALSVGAPVQFRDIDIGRVLSYQLTQDGKGVNIHVLIQSKYRHLLNTSSRFYNNSGVQASVDLRQGVKLNTSSIHALFDGGISVFTPGTGNKLKANSQHTLYADRKRAENQPIYISINFPPGAELPEHAPVLLRGQRVGEVTAIHMIGNSGSREVSVALDRDAEFLARQGSMFWIDHSEIRLSGINNPSDLLFGNNIAVLPAAKPGARATDFVGLRGAPPYKPTPGLTVELKAKELGSLALGSPVLYRGMPVGSISGFDVSLDGKSVTIFAHIDPQYATLVHSNSRFYNVSGVKGSAGLFSGIQFNFASLETIVGGGVSFITPDEPAPAAKERERFELGDTPPPKQ